MSPGEAQPAAPAAHSAAPGLLSLARTAAVIFVAGALIGTLLDQIHVVGGALHYPRPGPLGPPWWVFGQYGLAAAGFALPWRDLARKFSFDTPGRAADLAIPTVWFVASYVATSLFARFEIAVAIALVGTWLVRTARDGGARVALYSVAIAAVGVTWELVISRFGLFVYDAPRAFAAVPLWLPGLYLQAALLTRQIGRLALR